MRGGSRKGCVIGVLVNQVENFFHLWPRVDFLEECVVNGGTAAVLGNTSGSRHHTSRVMAVRN